MFFFSTHLCLDPTFLQGSRTLSFSSSFPHNSIALQYLSNEGYKTTYQALQYTGRVSFFFSLAFIVFVACSVGQQWWCLLSGLPFAFLLSVSPPPSPLLLERIFCITSTLAPISLVAVRCSVVHCFCLCKNPHQRLHRSPFKRSYRDQK